MILKGSEMIKEGRDIILALLFLTLLPAFTYADIVYLKSGEKVEGSVSKETGKRIYIVQDTDIGLINNNILLDDIDKVEKTGEGQELIDRYKESINSFSEAKKCFYRQDYYEAMLNYKKVIEVNPNYAEAYYNLGMVYLALGYAGMARDNFEKALRIAKASASSQTPDVQELIVKISAQLTAQEALVR